MSRATARRRVAGELLSRGSSATHRSRSLLEYLLHAKELAVAPALRRVGEGILPRQAGPDLVLAHHVRDGQDGRGRRHRFGVYFLEPLDRAEHHGKLPGESLDLIRGERDSCESGGFFYD